MIHSATADLVCQTVFALIILMRVSSASTAPATPAVTHLSGFRGRQFSLPIVNAAGGGNDTIRVRRIIMKNNTSSMSIGMAWQEHLYFIIMRYHVHACQPWR